MPTATATITSVPAVIVVTIVDERKKILKKKKLCYKCTGKYHSAAECRSERSCNNCNQRRHTSICNKKTENVPTLTSSEENSVIYPVVVVLINVIKCIALLESGAGIRDISSTIANLLRKPSVRKKTKQIEMVMNPITRNIEIYKATVENLSRNFAMDVEPLKVKQKTLLT